MADAQRCMFAYDCSCDEESKSMHLLWLDKCAGKARASPLGGSCSEAGLELSEKEGRSAICRTCLQLSYPPMTNIRRIQYLRDTNQHPHICGMRSWIRGSGTISNIGCPYLTHRKFRPSRTSSVISCSACRGSLESPTWPNVHRCNHCNTRRWSPVYCSVSRNALGIQYLLLTLSMVIPRR